MLEINEKTSKLTEIDFVTSPNFDDRPKSISIDTIIIHCISLPEGEYDNNYVIDFFQNRLDTSVDDSFKSLENFKVSSHLFIRRDGQIIQMVPFNKRAWHAGKSSFNGRSNFNDFSIGIELEGTISSKYTNEQYQSLNNVIASLKALYTNITNDNIIGHCDIAPDRKSDPGAFFDWGRVKRGEL